MSIRQKVVFAALVILAAILLLLWITHPSLTAMQLVITYWPVYAVGLVVVAIAQWWAHIAK